TQIHADNVASLKRAWTFHTGSGRFASSPMVVDSVMYFSAPNGVYAVDAVTGKQIWKYTPAGDAAPSTAPAPAAPPPPPPAGEESDAPQRGGRGGRGPGGGGGGGGGRGGGRGTGGESAGTALRGPAYWAGANGVGPRIYSTTTPGLAAIDART